jgi:rare lipoprotein A (peptidoglycan hydrolase)
LRCAKTAFATLGTAVLLGVYLLSAVRLDQASAAVNAGVAVPNPQSGGPAFFRESPIVGRAVYYGAELAGRPTASGESFDPGLLTAAHRTFPLGSEVQVTNLDNGLSTVVRINDRGPYSGDAVIDLSAEAARRIGLPARGSGRVELARVR